MSIFRRKNKIDTISKTIKETKEDHRQAVTIRTVSQYDSTHPSTQVYQAKIKEFKAENPMVTVEDASSEADEAWKAKVAADFAAGNEPDIILTYTGADAKFMIEQEKVVSLEGIRKEFPSYGSNISEEVLKSVEEFNGQTYAVPVKGFVQGLFINKALFKQYNIEIPTDWSKLETAIIALQDKNIVPIAAALGDMPHHWIGHLILAKGGVAAYEHQDIEVSKEDWVKGLEYFKTLYNLGAFPKDISLAKKDIVVDMLVKKEAAMLLDGNWAIRGFDNPDDITVLPILPITGWYITRKAWDDPVKRATVVKFVETMTSADTIAAMDMPIDSWLEKPAWDRLLSLIPGIAAGEEDISKLVDEIINLNQK